MPDHHPAIVELATELWRTSCTDILNRRMVNMGDWDEQGPDVQSGFLSLARAAYAAVLRDLMEPSDPMDKLWLSNNPDFLTYLQATAIEIGVEI